MYVVLSIWLLVGMALSLWNTITPTHCHHNILSCFLAALSSSRSVKYFVLTVTLFHFHYVSPSYFLFSVILFCCFPVPQFLCCSVSHPPPTNPLHQLLTNPLTPWPLTALTASPITNLLTLLLTAPSPLTTHQPVDLLVPELEQQQAEGQHGVIHLVWLPEPRHTHPRAPLLEHHCTVHYIILNNGILKSNSSIFLRTEGYITQYTP